CAFRDIRRQEGRVIARHQGAHVIRRCAVSMQSQRSIVFGGLQPMSESRSRGHALRLAIAALFAAVLLCVGPAAASAATRYAAPSGIGSSCTQAAPCSFFAALTGGSD